MGRVSNKVAFVTGAAAGIGRAGALALAREGAAVMVTDIDERGARVVADEVRSIGGEALACRHDVGEEADWAAAIAATLAEWGRLDVVVNNAGLGTNRPLLETSLDDWHALLRVNLDGVFLGTRMGVEAMRHLESRPRAATGSVINISSILGLVGMPDTAAYSASKGAVRLFTKTVALECAANGWRVRANSIHPGFILTPLVESAMITLAERAGTDVAAQTQTIAALHPLNRMGQAEEIASGIVYLASDESAFMTGAELVIDGGYTAR
jgi:3(or 17)beta-hydroxysteroid dehydrogenase